MGSKVAYPYVFSESQVEQCQGFYMEEFEHFMVCCDPAATLAANRAKMVLHLSSSLNLKYSLSSSGFGVHSSSPM